jgi:hypothetical protein
LDSASDRDLARCAVERRGGGCRHPKRRPPSGPVPSESSGDAHLARRTPAFHDGLGFGVVGPDEQTPKPENRWGDTDAYKESARRTAGYSKDDWKQIKADGDAIARDLAARLAAGANPGDADVQSLVDRHREQIDAWFYPCSIDMQVNLGDMYVADARFAATYDRYQPGLARFLRDAIRIRVGLPAATD